MVDKQLARDLSIAGAKGRKSEQRKIKEIENIEKKAAINVITSNMFEYGGKFPKGGDLK